jgi:hypothetical protein
MQALSKKAQQTLQALKNKVSHGTRMPSIKNISALLTECGIEHSVERSCNTVEHRSKGNRYVNSRHRGKEGSKLVIETIIKGERFYLSMDTSDSYYSWNTRSSATKLIQLIEQ